MPIGAILIWVLFRLPCCGDSMGVASQIPGAFNLMADTLKPLARTILPPLLPWCSPSLKWRSCIGGGSIGAQPKLEFKAVRLQTQFLSACSHISGIYWKSLSCYTREIRLFSLKCSWLCVRSPEELKTEYVLVLHTSVPSSEHRQSVKGGRLSELSLSPSRRNPLGLLLGFYTCYWWLCLPQPFLFCSHQHLGSGTESIQGWESGGGKQQTQDSHIWPLSFLSNLSKHSWKSHIIPGKTSKQFFHLFASSLSGLKTDH